MSTNTYLFWLAFFCAYCINGITGFSGNVFVMPVGMNTIGHSTSIVVLNCTGFLASVIIFVTNFKKVVWREVIKMCLIMAVFMVIGAWLITVLPLDFLSKIYGLAVIVIAARGLFFNKDDKDLPNWLSHTILCIAGLIQGMFVSGGSFVAIYALQKLKDKDVFRATTCAMWTILNGCYAAYGILTGGLAGEGLITLAGCIPLLIVATFIGQAVQKRFGQKQFLTFSYVLLLAIGVVLLVR